MATAPPQPGAATRDLLRGFLPRLYNVELERPEREP